MARVQIITQMWLSSSRPWNRRCKKADGKHRLPLDVHSAGGCTHWEQSSSKCSPPTSHQPFWCSEWSEGNTKRLLERYETPFRHCRSRAWLCHKIIERAGVKQSRKQSTGCCSGHILDRPEESCQGRGRSELLAKGKWVKNPGPTGPPYWDPPTLQLPRAN